MMSYLTQTICKRVALSRFLLVTIFTLLSNNVFASSSVTKITDGESVTYNEPDDVDVAFDGVTAGVGTLVITSGTTAAPHSVGRDNSLLALNIESGATLNLVTDDAGGGVLKATTITNAGTINFNDGVRVITGNIVGTGTGTFNLGDQAHRVFGSFTTLAGDSISLIVKSTTSAATIVVDDEVNIAAGTKLNVTLESTDIAGSNYTVISGGTGSDINYVSEADLNVDNSGTNRSGNLVFRTYLSGDSLILSAVEKSDTLATMSGEPEAYHAINNYVEATGTLAKMQAYLDSSSISDADKSTAIKSITPQTDNSTNRIIFNSSNASLNITSDRLGSLRTESSGFSSGDETISKNIWIQQFGSIATQGNVSGSEGYHSKSLGVAIGADKEIFQDFILGFSGSYSKSGTKSKSALQETGIDLYQGSIYSGYRINDTYFINSMLGMSWNEYASSRMMPAASSIAYSNYSGQNYFGRIEAGSDHILHNAFMITPKITLTAAHSRTEDYTEEGANTLNLNVKTNSNNFFEARFGTALTYKILTKFGIFAPNISVSYGYDFARSKQITNSSFIGQTTSFQSNAPKVEQGSWNLGIGLDIYKINALTLTADYNYDYRKHYHGHLGFLKAKYNF